MITPRFWCIQDHNFVIVKMRVVHAKVSDMQFVIEGRRMTCHAAPYFLRLTFDQDVVEDETARAAFDVDKEELTAYVPKRNKGEVFTDLDCTTKLLTTEVERKKMVQVVDGKAKKKGKKSADDVDLDAAAAAAPSSDGEEEEEEEEEELDCEMQQGFREEETIGECYGFNNEFENFFAPLQDQLVVTEVPEVDTTPIHERIRMMHRGEADKFISQGTDHYLADFMDDAEIREMMSHTPSYYAPGVAPPSWETLKALGEHKAPPGAAAAPPAASKKIQVLSSSRADGGDDDDDDDSSASSSDMSDGEAAGEPAAAAPAVPACVANIAAEAAAAASKGTGLVDVDMHLGSGGAPAADAAAAAQQPERCYPTVKLGGEGGETAATSQEVGQSFANPGDIGRAEVLQTGSNLTGFFHTRVDKQEGAEPVHWDCAKEAVGEDKPGESCPPHPEAFHKSELTVWEREEMLRLPKKRYLVVKDDEVFGGLIDLLACYAYDHITTQGEGNAESVWTFTKLSPTLSYVVKLPTPRHAAVCFYRRVVSFPLFRHLLLARRCLWDVAHILSRGDKLLIVRMLLRIKWHLDRDEFKYPLSKLYLAPYATWVQSVSPQKLQQWGAALAATLATVSKADVGLPLAEIEALGQLEED